jgi:heterodisulfide reductase subunit A
VCNGLCPYNAIDFREDLGVSAVSPALCQGCGTCIAACPAGAIQGSGFSNDQVLAQIEGLLASLDASPGVATTAPEPEAVPA